MKTVILCAVFLIFGAVLGSAVTGYLMNDLRERQNALLMAGELGTTVMQAEFIKTGEVDYLLGSLERGIPLQILAVNEPAVRDKTFLADSMIKNAKRYYVCTKTPIPAEINDIMQAIVIEDNTCAEAAN